MPRPAASASARDEDPAAAERRLVEGLLAGDPEAVGEFLERTHHAVYGYAARLGAEPELRRDWSHAALIGLVEDLRQGRFVYRGPGSFWAWFRKRAYFRVLDERRRGLRRRAREGEGLTDEDGVPDLDAYAGQGDPADELRRVEIQAAVEACLDKLPSADQRRVLWLLYAEDRSYQEIAELTASPLNTVRSWILRGRLLLRKCLIAALGLDAPAGAVGD